MARYPIWTFWLNELCVVAMALDDMGPHANLDDLAHWTKRLRVVNHALRSLGQVIHVTQQERATLRLILEFYEGRSLEEPLGLRAMTRI